MPGPAVRNKIRDKQNKTHFILGFDQSPRITEYQDFTSPRQLQGMSPKQPDKKHLPENPRSEVFMHKILNAPFQTILPNYNLHLFFLLLQVYHSSMKDFVVLPEFACFKHLKKPLSFDACRYKSDGIWKTYVTEAS